VIEHLIQASDVAHTMQVSRMFAMILTRAESPSNWAVPSNDMYCSSSSFVRTIPKHWHVYRKWNERLFHEMFLAWKMGRADKNPAEFWYQG
jgi:hypothetical protein